MSRSRPTIGALAVLLALMLVLIGRGLWSSSEPPAPTTPILAFFGKVDGDQGKPVAAARVVALWVGENAEPRSLGTTAVGESSGEYRLAVQLPPGELGVLVLTATAPGHQSAGRSVVQPGSETLLRQDFRLLGGGTRVRVRVEDAGAAPVTGAQVTVAIDVQAGDPDALLLLQGTTGPDGAVVFDAVPRVSAELHWEARAGGFGWAFGVARKPREQPETLIVARLQAMARLDIAVVDRNGQPASDLTVGLAQAQGPWGDRARAEGPGRFVALVPSGQELRLRVEGNWVLFGGRDEMSFLVPPGASRHAIQVVVEPGGAIAGRVVSRAGEPLVSATVRLVPSDRKLTSERAVATGADGRFRANGLRSGTSWDLEVRHPGFAPGFLDGAAPGATLEIVLSQGGAIAGRVLDESGLGLEGLEVVAHRVEVHGTVTQGLREYASTLSGATGDYVVGALNPGTYRIEIRPKQKMQWAPTAARVLEAAIEEGVTARMDDVRLPRGGILRGRLRVDRGSAAQRRIHVAILRAGKPGAPHRVVAQTSAEGGFVLEGLEPGSLAVTVHLPELGFVTQIVEIRGGRTTEATFELGERLTLAGVVSRWDGKPAAGAALDAYRRVGTVSTEIPGRAPDDMTGNRVLADGAGRFRLAGLEAGTYRLRVTQREAPPVEMDVTVPRGPVEVQLPAPAECEVVLTDAEDRPIAGRVIAAQESARLYSGTGVGDEQGTLRFTNLPAGRYRFQAVVDGLPSAEAELAAGGRARVVLKQTVR